ncbi:MAG TPA: NIPSNAP family protein [Bryobacteraceae bacterium]|nr:NIPSNAP family protein [Bryobacteraceae bacterium]
MNRRDFLHTAAAAGPVGALAAAAPPASAVKVIELRYYRMRNGSQVQRTTSFLQTHYLPAAQRAGITAGLFSSVVAPESPSILVVKGYASFEALGASLDKLAADKEFSAAAAEYNAPAEPNFQRAESSLLRAFHAMEAIDFPTGGVVELRTYESKNPITLRRKIGMFEEGGEIAIFRRTGLAPVFFGEMIVGPRMPNLTYMVAFRDQDARTKAWSAFGADPEWQKLRAQPGLADSDIVSGISNSLWSPLKAK